MKQHLHVVERANPAPPQKRRAELFQLAVIVPLVFTRGLTEVVRIVTICKAEDLGWSWEVLSMHDRVGEGWAGFRFGWGDGT